MFFDNCYSIINDAKGTDDAKSNVPFASGGLIMNDKIVIKGAKEHNLKDINLELYDEVSAILKYHIDVRHIRGGQSTKEKYKKIDL